MPKTPLSNKESFSDFFIHRPVFAWVVNIIVILLGVTAFFQLSTRQYPLTESTTISVRSVMEGSGKVMEQQVTKPLEDALSALQGLESMNSNTQKGESKIYLTFQNRSIDGAAADVRDIVSKTKTKLPDDVEVEVTKGNVDSPTILEISVTGKNIPLVDLFYGADSILKSAMESIQGVSTVEVYGGSEMQMNIVLDPIKMSAYNITASDVSEALKSQNFEKAAGQIKELEREFTLTTQAKLKTPADFRNIIVSKIENKVVRISDIGVVNIEPKEETMFTYYNSEPAVSLVIRAQANANPIDIAKEVKSRIAKLEKRLPKGSQVHVAMDKSIFIEDSIKQVYSALIEAVVLVLLVVFIFLRSLKASLVPLVTIPIALIGTFFLMSLMGFTINVLSLLALVLAIGLVVDDAIIVLENIYRYMERGMGSFQAAILGTREIQFSIIAMTITLAAVYAPIAITPGVIGKVFKEFALTLAGAVILSGLTALTLSPMMCAYLLKNQAVAHGHAAGATSGGFWSKTSQFIENIFCRLEQAYMRGVGFALRKKTAVLFFSAFFSIASTYVGFTFLKKELSPTMDEGLISGSFISSPSMNLTYIKKRASQIDAILKEQPDLLNRSMTLNSGDRSLTKSMLKPWSNRTESCADVVSKINAKSEDILGLLYRARCVNSSVLTSSESQFPLSFKILTNKSTKDLISMGRQVRRALSTHPGVGRLEDSETIQQDEYVITINRDRIAQLGVDPDEISRTMTTLVRGSDIGTFEKDDRICRVHVWISSDTRKSIEGIKSMLIRGKDTNNKPAMVPLSEIISISLKKGESLIEHSMKQRVFNIEASIDPSASLADTYLSFKEKVDKILPSEYSIEPSGELENYFKQQGTIYLIFGLALAFIFLVMAAQFESVRDPLIILISVPLALGGALLSLFFLKSGSLNVYTQIGLITLIGLITKHGILLVDFANQAKAKGAIRSIAIVESCQLRLRPILMTTFAMVLGAIPLAFATGAGSEARRQIGVVIVGGMSIGTVFTLFVVPVLYVIFSKKSEQERGL